MRKVKYEELYEYCIKYEYGIPEDILKPIFRNICNAVSYLHKNDIAHLDLKLENIMYDENTGEITIIDFGFAQLTSYSDKITNRIVQKKIDQCYGSIHYYSPEILLKKRYDGKKSDIWSLGVLLYSCLFGYFPFDDADNQIIFEKIEQVQYKIPLDAISDDATSLLVLMLEKDPDIRPSITEVLDHPWLN